MKMGKGRETKVMRNNQRSRRRRGGGRCWRVGSRVFKEVVVQMCLVQVRDQDR